MVPVSECRNRDLHIPKLIKVITRILSGDHTLAANMCFQLYATPLYFKVTFSDFLLTSLTVSANNGQPHAKGNKKPINRRL